MLRITASRNAAGAADYHDQGLRQGDYYTNDPSIGVWGGKVAARLGLSGEVEREDFVALCHNQKPDGTKLNPRHSSTRKVGYDFTFSVPKSVSVAYALSGDERIREAFERSVEKTMQEVEQDMRTQQGQGKEKHYAKTGEMVWASFTHRTSRPVGGVPDPHLHRHCFVMNTTWNNEKQRFQAGEFSTLKQAAPYYEAACHARMAMEMKKLGYEVERRGYSWEVKQMGDTLLQKFSRRTAAIEAKVKAERAKGVELTAKQKDKLGALTRAKKLAGASWQKLQETWRSWLDEGEQGQWRQVQQELGAGKKKKTATAKQYVNRAEEHCFERKSVVKEYQLKAEALKRGYGEILPEEVNRTIAEGAYYQREVKGQTHITTRSAIEEEYQMLRSVQEGRGKHLPLNASYQPKADYLNEEQKVAIHHALNDTNQVTIIAGGAGTGKTTLMKEVRDGIEAGGKRMIGFAPSAAASRGVMREEGFDKADTLAQLLQNPKMQEQTKDSVIWVDEAGMIGNKDMNRLFAIAKQQQARILLTGDVRQHSGVARGDALRILEQEGGIKVARVHKIQRQRDQLNYKMAVNMAAQGKADAALLKLDQMGDVIEQQDGQKRLRQLVEDYTKSCKAGKSALIVSPTHIEGQNVTQAVRDRLKSEGQITGEEQSFVQLKNSHWTEEMKADAFHYRDGQKVIEFHQNAKGHIRGERWQVEAGAQDQLYSVAAKQAAKNPLQQIDLGQATKFSIYEKQKIALAKGDKIRLTKGGKTREQTRVNNGDIFTVTGFTKQGHVKLHTGKSLDKDYGHWDYGIVTTSHSAQGKTVQHVFIAQSSQSSPASNQQQFYVSISRGKEQCRIYTDDKKALEQSVKQDNQRMTAREVAQLERKHSRTTEKKKNVAKEQKQIRYARSKEL